ncbi:hypothetical protein BGZ95_000068 [Linnemannia exigua]|uniref:F-box domain-containing protein n=1 Tax=Linnemannia exigua TaxID=604196 RepID=A0AAD4D8U2_9FUNG|nr:hypothetical protein BGZ95_000068 [Linnemannia exigua]
MFRGNGGKNNLFQSTSSLQALARNIRHIRCLFFRVPELAYYYNCVLTFEDMNLQSSESRSTLATTTTTSTTTTAAAAAPARQAWLPPPDIRTCQFIAMPRMTCLTHLTMYPTTSATPYTVPSVNDPQATLAQVCWIMSLNPGLTYLIVHGLFIVDIRSERLLGNALAGLDKLKKLQLWLFCPDHRLQPGPRLLFQCRPSIQSITLYIDEIDDLPGAVSGGDQEDVDKRGGDLVTATWNPEPLTNLEELLIKASEDWASRPSIRSIFAHCPNLKKLKIPYIPRPQVTDAIGQYVGEMCPKIESLIYDARQVEQYDSVPFSTLPAPQVTHLEYKGFLLNILNPEPDLALQRHSATLRSIRINNISPLFWIKMSTILRVCVNLESLVILGQDRIGHYISLDDAIEHPWGCTRLTSLTLSISGCELPVDNDLPPYYSRQAPISLTEAETQHFAQLEMLYLQIGKLTEIMHLDLNMVRQNVVNNDFHLVSDPTLWFPAMLSLGNAWTGRPGYLHHLSGLSKLRNLYGSFSADLEEARSTVDYPEVVWIDQHWPDLERIDSFASEKDITAPFKWLLNKRVRDGRRSDLTLGIYDDDY